MDTSNNNLNQEEINELFEKMLKQKRHESYKKFIDKNKNRLKDRIVCEDCGKTYNYYSKSIHKKSMYHMLSVCNDKDELLKFKQENHAKYLKNKEKYAKRKQNEVKDVKEEIEL